MAKRIAVKKKKRKPLFKDHITLSDLKLVKYGKELRGVDMAYHIGSMHPSVITKIHVGVIHHSMKYQVIKWVKEGKLYIKKE